MTHQAVTIGLEEAYPLWALSSYDVGGLQWSTVDIGKVPYKYCSGSKATVDTLNIRRLFVRQYGRSLAPIVDQSVGAGRSSVKPFLASWRLASWQSQCFGFSQYSDKCQTRSCCTRLSWLICCKRAKQSLFHKNSKYSTTPVSVVTRRFASVLFVARALPASNTMKHIRTPQQYGMALVSVSRG